QIEDMLKVSDHFVEDSIQINYNSNRSFFVGNKLFYTTNGQVNHRSKYKFFNNEYYIAYDGKLDNREELLVKLNIIDGEQLSDSYLILRSYLEWDESFLQVLEGDYAFSIWDEYNHKLILARDRLGVKNLFYSTKDGLLIWGSELKQILRHPALRDNN